MDRLPTVIENEKPREMAQYGSLSGGLEGTSRTSRELATWFPPIGPIDALVNPSKETADARTADSVHNDGYVQGGLATHRDSIVGSVYRLNSRPNWRVLNASQEWADEFSQAAESRFNLAGESPRCWFDVQRMNTFTGIVRLGVAGFCLTGEILMTSEWVRESDRPFRTAFQSIDPNRLSNPDGRMDTTTLRRGVEKGVWGEPVAYHITQASPYSPWGWGFVNAQIWNRVQAYKPWGRPMVLHILEQLRPDQSRGIADFVAAMKSSKMTRTFKDATLQNAVINAMFVASIESELPPTVVAEMLGGGATAEAGLTGAYGTLLNAIRNYFGNADNVRVDGAKIPVLFPGTKLNLKTLGTPGGVGTDFEKSLLRNTCAALGISYEEFSRDYSQVSYSGARASINQTERFMQSRKKLVADRQADFAYGNWLEEQINAGEMPMPPGRGAEDFYKPLHRDAYCQASWIGAGGGMIDMLKETQAAIMKIKSGISTYEIECAKMGLDWREVFDQQAREQGVIKEKGLMFITDASAQGKAERQGPLKDTPDSDSGGGADG